MNITNLLVFFVCIISQISAQCGPERKFSLFAPCQATCEKPNPPIICIPKPGCYCEGDKIWDKIQKKCVFRGQCTTKSSNNYGAYTFGSSGSFYGLSSASVTAKSKSSKGFGIFSAIKSIISLPVKIPSTILKDVQSTIKNVILFRFKIIRLPYTVVKTIFGSFFDRIRKGISWIFDTILNIGSFDAEFVIGVINKIKGMFGWIVKESAGFGIDIVQVFKNSYSFVVKNAEGTVSGIFKFGGSCLVKLGSIFNGGFKLSHIKFLLQLPIIKNIVGIIEKIEKGEFNLVLSQLKDGNKFIGGIIKDHKDFFDPVFNVILKDKDAVFNALTTILEGLNFHDLSKVIAKIQAIIGGQLGTEKNGTSTEKGGLDLESGNANGQFGKWGYTTGETSKGSKWNGGHSTNWKGSSKGSKESTSKDSSGWEGGYNIKGSRESTSKGSSGWEGGYTIKGSKDYKWGSGSEWKGQSINGGKSSNDKSSKEKGSKGSNKWDNGSKSKGTIGFNWGLNGGSSKSEEKKGTISGSGVTDTAYWTWKGIR